MDLWHFFSDYILFLNTKLFALVRGIVFNLLGGRHSIAYVYKGCRFYSFRDVLLGRNVILENRCRISGPIEIGSDTTVCEGVVITGPTKIGSGCIINYHTWIDRYVNIGDRVAIGHRSFVITFNHDYSDPTARGCGDLMFDSIEVGQGTWIGSNVVILPGVNIGCAAVIGAGSVVTRKVPDSVLVAGNPAKIKKHLFIAHPEHSHAPHEYPEAPPQNPRIHHVKSL